MGASVAATAIFSTNSMFHFSGFSKPKLGVILPKEIAYRPLVSTTRKDCRRSISSVIRAEGSRQRRSPKDVMPGKTSKGDEINIQSSPDSKSSHSLNKEEIISIFKRIQSSISKGDSSSSKKRSSKSSEDQKPNIDAVLEILRDSNTITNVALSNTKDEQQGLTHLRGQKEKKTDDSTTSYQRPRRPPSKFVKRSPIQSTFNSKEKVELKTEETSPAANHAADEREAVKLEEMKLSQLKELAKSRGLKGYSKLKKIELVELLIRC